MFFSLALGSLLATALLGVLTGSASALVLSLLAANLALWGLWWYRRRPGETITAAGIVGALLVMILILIGVALGTSYSKGIKLTPFMACFFLGVVLLLGLAVFSLKRQRSHFDAMEASRLAQLNGTLPRESSHGNKRAFSISLGLLLLLLAVLRFVEKDSAESSTGLFAPLFRLSESLIGPAGPAVLLAALGITFMLHGWLVRK